MSNLVGPTRAGIAYPAKWGAASVATSQTNSVLSMDIFVSGGSIVAPAPGLVLGFTFILNAAVSAGTLTINTRVNSTILNATNITAANGTVLNLSVPFARGDVIDFSYTSDALLAGPTAFRIFPFMSFN